MVNQNDMGSVSEWNEGNFKNLRLHEAQIMINNGKINPFSFSDNGVIYNYQHWKYGIDILYGEGQSKYSTKEIENVEAMKNVIEIFLEAYPPFKTVKTLTHSGEKTKFNSIHENQKKIKMFLEKYERVVKKYNDEHGLSTRNVDMDIRGL